MYRLVLYVLILMIIAGLLFSILGILPYDPILFLITITFVVAISLILDGLFAWAFDAPTNVESVYITALILVLIITPIKDIGDISYLLFLFWASVWGVASKYIFAINKKHIFNPAALAVVITAFSINQYASWWIGTLIMSPFVILGGFLVVRKIKRFDMVASFILLALVFIVGARATDFYSSITLLYKTLFYTPLLFFAFIMLTEPLTTPPHKSLRIIYGAFCGFLFSPLIHIGALFFTPELSLISANLFSYIISPKQKLVLKLKDRIQVAQDTYDFVFATPYSLSFKPGKYMEWTLGHKKIDSRGNRRYFTIASSPTEKREIRMGIKFYPNGSSFKKKLLSMNAGEIIVASQLAGDFTIPRSKKKKLVFIAGGIGITPFRSMIKYLIDTKQKRDIVLLYSNKTPADIAYKNILDQAEKELGIKIIYTVTDKIKPGTWQGRTGYIDTRMIVQEIPDYSERYFYLSGTHGMVTTFDSVLQEMGVGKSHIKKDFFPGFA